MNEAIKIIKKELLNMPNLPGVYRMLDKNDKILYVGVGESSWKNNS